MANSRTFALLNGLTVEKVGEHLVTWFETTKGMIAEGSPAQGGYFVQAKDKDDGWKKLSGLTKAIQVQLIKADDNVVVNCDFGKWSDKVGAGAVGMLVFAPLAATAAFGAVKQNQLPNEVFEEIEKYILSGGISARVSIGAKLNDNEIECPSCGAKNSNGQKFCKACGAKLGKECPHCGASVEGNAEFCPSCGNSLTVINVCINCGAPLEGNQKFCPSCGTKQEQVCPKCGAVIDKNTRFCPSCGAQTTEKKICPNCKSEVHSDEAFCKKCGAKLDVE